ncbi:hypothetical protein AZI86_07290 [Bdellovibrio bacteriovorus]|uniref:Uncharacterized protein n=1 Tax=Bdellovibrio bacteriovorus TaxID=959 RepID=A0A150WQR8_BDEBC|nr:hypothetical protein [Bdellovibrio bacteriovorus]KYG66832.1 hypothetical protein AZI86_07290 [Bdellovibrio bacteriovorus]
MLKKQRKSSIRNQKGMAVFEMIPLLMIIVLFVNFSLGFFGAIHTGILNSISARNYTFETFRNRANLTYFKNTDPNAVSKEFSKAGLRLHGSTTENENNSQNWLATTRMIDFINSDNRAAEITGTDSSTHNKTREVPDGRNTTVGVNPIWIKTTYGICLNASCGS